MKRFKLCLSVFFAFAAVSIFFKIDSKAQSILDDDELESPIDFDQPDTYEESPDGVYNPRACKRATAQQLSVVNSGNIKTQQFLSQCSAATGNSSWCLQLIRPNPASIATFRCTYGENQVHQLIHPDEKTWPSAFQAVRLVQGLEAKGIKPCLIYNWWRPEPYNVNVGGAAGRHPFATSVDVRFCSMSDMERAFSQLCVWRKEGKLRALGYYGSTGLHLGISDKTANTWGKSCP